MYKGEFIFCAEDMGLYANFLLKVCSSKKLTVCMESPLRIKKSLGIQRGKNDALNSIRIAQYASDHFSTLKVWQRPGLLSNNWQSFLPFADDFSK